MFRRVLASVSFAALVSTAALAQPVPPLLTSAPVSRTAFLSLDAVQAHVNAILTHAAASEEIIAVALAPPAAPLLSSTPVVRR
jgi:hypothetical protein